MDRRGFLRRSLVAAAPVVIPLTKEVEDKIQFKPIFEEGCNYCGYVSKDLLIIPIKVSNTIIAAERIVCPKCYAKMMDAIHQIVE